LILDWNRNPLYPVIVLDPGDGTCFAAPGRDEMNRDMPSTDRCFDVSMTDTGWRG
jgi:hypothetical protein